MQTAGRRPTTHLSPLTAFLMRRARRSRVSDRHDAIDELFSTRGLEADPVARDADRHFPLRPFAADIPRDDLGNADGPIEESETDRLFRHALEASGRGRPSEAVVRYRAILELDPGHVGARNNLSLLLDAAGDHDEALEHLDAAVNRAPDDVALLVSRGAVRARLKLYPEAETDLRRAIRLQPGSAAAHFNLGLVLWRKGLPAEAITSLRKAIAIEADHPGAHFYLGEALHQAGDSPGALAALERAALLTPADPKIFQLAGRILDKLARPEDARAMYQRARGARPS